MPRIPTSQRIDSSSPQPDPAMGLRTVCPLARFVGSVGLGAFLFWLSFSVLGAEAKREPDYMTLARICLHEGRWRIHERMECAAIRDVIRDRAQVIGTSFHGAAHLYSDKVFDRSRTDPRRWLAWLRGDLRRPKYWPRSNVPWDKRPIPTCGDLRCRDAWSRTIEHAKWLMGPEDPESHCEIDPHHWGDDDTDLERARRQGLRQVDCGETLNLFWVVPRRIRSATPTAQ